MKINYKRTPKEIAQFCCGGLSPKDRTLIDDFFYGEWKIRRPLGTDEEGKVVYVETASFGIEIPVEDWKAYGKKMTASQIRAFAQYCFIHGMYEAHEQGERVEYDMV